MRRMLGFSLLVVFLSACGGGSGSGGATDDSAANNPACLLLADAAATFGEGAVVDGYEGPSPITASCAFSSADGVRSGEIVLFTAESMGAVTPADQVASLVEAWDGATETALQPVAELGEGAQLATDLPGYQTQIVFTKGESVIAVMGSSGDSAMSGEQIARAIAQAASVGVEAN